MMRRGFTLIELIIAITILSLLAAVATGSYLNSLKIARDARKQADLEQIRQALELYKSENVNSQYPQVLTELETTNYIGRLPINPSTKVKYGSGGVNNNYQIDPTRTFYTLSVLLERRKDGSGNCSTGAALFNCSDPCVYCVDQFGVNNN